jgi:hypothetical protein
MLKLHERQYEKWENDIWIFNEKRNGGVVLFNLFLLYGGTLVPYS